MERAARADQRELAAARDPRECSAVGWMGRTPCADAPAVQHLEEQILFGAEVPQDAALGGACLFSDMVEGHAPETGLGEELPGDLQDMVPGPLPPFRAGNLRACHPFLPEMRVEKAEKKKKSSFRLDAGFLKTNRILE